MNLKFRTIFFKLKSLKLITTRLSFPKVQDAHTLGFEIQNEVILF